MGGSNRAGRIMGAVKLAEVRGYVAPTPQNNNHLPYQPELRLFRAAGSFWEVPNTSMLVRFPGHGSYDNNNPTPVHQVRHADARSPIGRPFSSG